MTSRPDPADLLAELTIDEKADLVTGEGMWTTRAVERLDIPQMTVTDGPNGARGGGLMGTGTATACIPAGSTLGATWDPDLVERLGCLLGDEAIAKGSNVLLAPTINLHRSPLGGRNFECYSEDPLLTGRLAAGFVRGVQSRDVATTPKHFVVNDSEFERNSIDVRVDERTLRELYLLPFELAVKEGGAWGVMSAYNRLNGPYCSEHEWLLRTVLRNEWGFDGFVVSDWFAARSTAGSVKAGLSLEMPGAGIHYGRELIRAALDAGDITEDDLDRIVHDVLVTIERSRPVIESVRGEERELDRAEDRALIRDAAIAGTVLLRNDGTLPLDVGSVGSLAVVGPNARNAKVMGGGSAKVRAYRATSPLDALTDRLDGIDINYAQGADIDRSTPPVGSDLLEGPMAMEFYNGEDWTGPIVAETELPTGDYLAFGSPAPDVAGDAFSVRCTGRVVSEGGGPHAFRVVRSGGVRVLVGGQTVLEETGPIGETGDDFFGFGSVEVESVVDLPAGEAVDLVVEFTSADSIMLRGWRLGAVSQVERDLVGAAVEAAAACDAAVVVVGTNDDWETEGRDRDLFELPGEQVELIERVTAANDKTVVVVNTGGPHDLSWLDQPAAVLWTGFGGQEMGDAVVDVLLGEADPGGRMPYVTPARYEHNPAFANYPGENSTVRYGEGLFIGQRWFDSRYLDPLIPFGHGLSYASFDWQPRVQRWSAGTELAKPVVVEVEVTNTSDRRGSEVVQVYVEPPPPVLHRPLRELKGFAKVALDPGETGTASIELDARSFAYFDPGDPLWEKLAAGMPVPAEAGESHRPEPGWYVEPGEYTIVVARSATDHVERLAIELTGEETRLDA